LVHCYKYEDYFEIYYGVLRFELKITVRDTILMFRDLRQRMSGYSIRFREGLETAGCADFHENHNNWNNVLVEIPCIEFYPNRIKYVENREKSNLHK
jgi:hypothetical protein